MTTALLAGAAVLGAYAALVAVSGGFDIRIAGVRIRSHAWIRAALPAAVLAAAWVVAARRGIAAAAARAWSVLDSGGTARALVVVAALWSAAAGVLFGTYAAGGADSSGYVSQSLLLAGGRLTDTVPRDLTEHWRLPLRTLTPLGFVPGSRPPVIAPSYPPGFPLLLAPLAALSQSGVYLLVPLLGAVAVWLCYRLGCGMGDALAGGVGAALLSVSPTFLFQIVQPMSDVPVTTFWLLAMLLAVRGGAAGGWAAGAAASIALLIRPNLAPLASIPAALVVHAAAGERLRAAARFLAPIAVAGAALAWIQYTRYGSPFASGYGNLDDLFALENVLPNLSRYPRWLTETHTPFIWLFVLAPALVRRVAPSRPLAVGAVLLSAGVLAVYLPYVQFGPHEWTYTRFMLPAIALMLPCAAAVTLSFVRRLPPAGATIATLAVFGGLAAFGLLTADRRLAFDLREGEQRYVRAGEFVRQRLPENAIVLAAQHSGSVRLYGRRPIVRWDLIAPDELDSTLGKLRESGRLPVMVLDAFELKPFHARFGAAGQRAVEEARLICLMGSVQIYAFD